MKKFMDEISDIALGFPSVRRIVLFGSQARGDANSGSDYDIAVFGCSEKEKAKFLSAIDETGTLRKIDVIFISEKDKDKPIYKNIEKDGIDIMNKFMDKLGNLEKAVARLHEAVNKLQEDRADAITRDSLIHRFEFTEELAWKTSREYLITEEISELNSPKSVMREAFANHLIYDEDGWLQILKDRNCTSHIYDEDTAEEICERIINEHIKLFDALLSELKSKK